MSAKLVLVYFSPTFTTKKIVSSIAQGFPLGERQEIDVCQKVEATEFTPEDTVVFGVPVYAGRIPATARERIACLRGNGASASTVVVYGNRDYEDALLELNNLLQSQDFRVVSSAAFVAQHSYCASIAEGRPDSDDLKTAREFGEKTYHKLLKQDDWQRIDVKGNRPYRKYKTMPVRPKGSSACTSCGLCVSECPTEAIPALTPRITMKDKCIACARCVLICPVKARKFPGLFSWLVSFVLRRKCSLKREVETFF